MVRALFFLLIAFRVTVCPVICAAGGELGFCCHGCAAEAGQQDPCSEAKTGTGQNEVEAAAQPECPCCSDQDGRGSEDMRSAEERFVSDCDPIAPAGEDGLCNGDCACKVLPEKGKSQIDLHSCFVLEGWNCAGATAVAIKSYPPSPIQLHAASPPAGKAVRIACCSLLI
ncbi:MAG: hypothetical protein ACTHK7_15270 [Aureliella sp.]